MKREGSLRGWEPEGGGTATEKNLTKQAMIVQRKLGFRRSKKTVGKEVGP